MPYPHPELIRAYEYLKHSTQRCFGTHMAKENDDLLGTMFVEEVAKANSANALWRKPCSRKICSDKPILFSIVKVKRQRIYPRKVGGMLLGKGR